MDLEEVICHHELPLITHLSSVGLAGIAWSIAAQSLNARRPVIKRMVFSFAACPLQFPPRNFVRFAWFVSLIVFGYGPLTRVRIRQGHGRTDNAFNAQELACGV
eukprot:gnl/MRDRNA2_/MRDRNA2_69188_c0_seq1.p1 gnl/MRDRNA2_/MRDRNA2_69188_c0~~gnl/MRDRNA2_/MRDRNA2_69188_c0_seq1.p1  ORF type:complete len:104 (+),score=6.04 gnl/MRDRNA2_/MRDRNA2_69188_c0_seq1:173-484(+)